ncbi:flexible cuticle protein 12-like [Prorops nasuta]|uniref:flexible cuticle protein 12-like n=1 Tax=Prorops nasuta TaxID=863751 RepID=UPI0034CE1101
MKMICLVLAALVAVAAAVPATVEKEHVVLLKEAPSDNIGLDGYHYGYELSNGESKQETAQLKTVGKEQAIVVSGSYSFVDPATNVKYTVEYTADETGFHPKGAHLPVA